MTYDERWRAYNAAMARAHALEADAADERGDAEGLCPVVSSEDRRVHNVGLQRHMAKWHRENVAYFAAVASGRDAPMPEFTEYPDFEDSPAAAVTATTNQPGAQ